MIQCYEQLRQEVLNQHPNGNPRLGQTVLVHRGVVAWMHALGSCLSPLTVIPLPKPLESLPAVPGSMHGELVRLLSEAVLTMARTHLS